MPAWRPHDRPGGPGLRPDRDRGSKGAFYTYFARNQDLLVALLDDDAADLDELVTDAARHSSGIGQIRRFVATVVDRGADVTAVQLRADLWTEIGSDELLRARFSEVTAQRRAALATLIDDAIKAAELADVPANALAAIFLALSDGLMLQGGVDPSVFRWANVRRTLDLLLEGLRREPAE